MHAAERESPRRQTSRSAVSNVHVLGLRETERFVSSLSGLAGVVPACAQRSVAHLPLLSASPDLAGAQAQVVHDSQLPLLSASPDLAGAQAQVLHDSQPHAADSGGTRDPLQDL